MRSCINCKYFRVYNFYVYCLQRKYTKMHISLIHPNYLIRNCSTKRNIPFKYLFKAAVKFIIRYKREIEKIIKEGGRNDTTSAAK